MSQQHPLRTLFASAMEPVQRLAASPSPMNTAHLPIVLSALEQVVVGIIDVLVDNDQRLDALETAGDPQSFTNLSSRVDADEAKFNAQGSRLDADEQHLAADDTRFGTDEDQLQADKVLIHTGDTIPGADTALGDAFSRLPPDGSPASGSTTTPTSPVVGVGDVPVPQDDSTPQPVAVVEAPAGSVPGLTPQTPIQEVTSIPGGQGVTPQVIRDQAPTGEIVDSPVEGSQEGSAPDVAPSGAGSTGGVASVADVPPAVAPFVEGRSTPLSAPSVADLMGGAAAPTPGTSQPSQS